jgi:hypothetical protein
MVNPDGVKNDADKADSTDEGVGDVETAGETTAAATISGPADTKPVGADTMLKVADTQEPAESGDND